MSTFSIITDSCCDLPVSMMDAAQIGVVDLTFRFDHSVEQFTNKDLTCHEFYERMRGGSVVKTSAPNPNDYRLVFEAEFQKGLDVLCMPMSAALSTSYNSARLAALELSEEYPDRKICVLETGCASTGLGLFVNQAVRFRDQGVSLAKAVEYLDQLRPSICHWFSLEDLEYLRRGGRCSAAAAFASAALQILPILHVDDEGLLVARSKVRGRRSSMRTLITQYKKLSLNPGADEVYIVHGDCPEDAAALDDLLFEACGIRASVITHVGPVIGAHSGPGAISLFFLGKNR